MIQSNKELAEAVNEAVLKSGIKKAALAQKIGISVKELDTLLHKKAFSLDDANRILHAINYNVVAKVEIKKTLEVIL